eukprot:CAMPEP_0196220330 /NCGR_PEP_ID=MMETSP0912-20130531/40548_1 /TAXON_ID=49265 /ORGANISM="Thalassiosira rotula, Strain GSO102" /LENGTH=128 /DNA_ID=CAMNT_0041498539 /DNA_START=123 /DNA_END=506 /DNA_ORIENTATION=-
MTSPITRTLSPSGPVRRWKYRVDINPYRDEGLISSLSTFSPDLVESLSVVGTSGPPSMDRKNFLVLEETFASMRASLTSSLRQTLTSANCVLAPSILYEPLNGSLRSQHNVAVLAKTPTIVANKKRSW